MKLSLAVAILALVGMHVSTRASGQAHDGLQLRSLQVSPDKGYCNQSDDGDGHQRHGNCTQNGSVGDPEIAQEANGPNGNLLQQTGVYWKHMFKQRFGHGDHHPNNNTLCYLPQEDGDLEQDDEESGQNGGSVRGQRPQNHLHSESNDGEGLQEGGRDEDGNDEEPNSHDRPHGNCTRAGECDGDGPESDSDGTGPNGRGSN